MIGTTLSHFRITAKLGEGGMGEVYRAEDTKLGREVAIKVLPGAVASDPERLARFEREAKVLASLNHPNIAGIYSLESVTAPTGTLHFLVMELADGDDLSALMALGALPVEEALGVALQLAEGLEAAHDQGIIHRDLKPANIKIDAEGRVKVLDFGLAKALEAETGLHQEASLSPLSMSPTLTAQMTQAGVILGTAAYMSPEQGRGKSVDARADLWAFGVILYEMLTGTRLFAGDTVTDVLASVVRSEPDWDSLPAATPASVRRLLERCLAKDRDLRLHHAGDARLEILAAQDDEPPSTSQAKPQPRSRWIPWAVAAGVSLVALWAIFAGSKKTTAPVPMIRFHVELPAGASPLEPRVGPAVALSPDDNALVLSVMGPGDTPLFLRTLEETAPQAIRGTEGGTLPFFSSDGTTLGFFRDNEIVQMQLPGGVPKPIVDLRDMGASRNLGDRGACWTEDGTFVFAASQESPLYRIPAGASEPEPLTQLEGSERSHRWPAVLPGRNAVLFTVEEADDLSFDEARIEALDLATGVRKVVAEGASLPQYSPSGHLVFVRAGDLYAVRFDIADLSTQGAPVAVYSGVLHHAPSGSAAFHVSRSGSLVVVPEYRQVELDLVVRDPDGSIRLLWSPEQNIESLRASPDGRQVALMLNREVWLYELERGVPTPLTSDTNAWGGLTWSPDSDRIVFSAQPRGVSLPNMYEASTLADEPVVAIFDDDESREPATWNADGTIVFEHLGDIYKVHPDRPELVEQLTDTPAVEMAPAVSPDGRWLAYTSPESGAPEIYLRRLARGTRSHRVSTGGGTRPAWSPDGSRLYYQNREAILRVDLDLGSSVELGTPRPFVPDGVPDFGDLRQFRPYDVLPTPGALVMLKPRRTPPRPNPIVTLNWARELAERVP